MSRPEEKRAAFEIMRLILAVKIRLQQGKDKYIEFDNAGNNLQANQELLDEAEFVIRVRNRIANALKNNLAGPGIINTLANDHGYSVADLKTEFNPVFNMAETVVSGFPNVTRTQVDNAPVIDLPELVANDSTNTLP